MNANKPLEDFRINLRLKLSGLWASLMFCYVYGDYFSLYVPHKIEGFMNGDNLLNSPQKLFAASILMAVPALMICLSLVLRPALSRWLNILFGSLYTGIMLLIACTTGWGWWSFYVFLAILESILTAWIVWLAWHWPRQLSSNPSPSQASNP